jgi:hypothetical protein
MNFFKKTKRTGQTADVDIHKQVEQQLRHAGFWKGTR